MLLKNLIFTCFLLCVNNIIAQTNVDAGFLPKIVLSKKINNATKWVNSVESRTIFYDEEYKLLHSLIDLSSILSLKTGLNQSFNFGYILRFRNNETIHRTFQHYNFVNQLTALKIGHRFAFEQFYQSKKQTAYRSRYRISLEKALNGEKVDINEFYIKLGNEYLYDFEDLEIRFTPYLGYQATANDKVEFGLDYRLSNLINNPTENDFWIRVTWYISLN
jgi:hypothetical protein